jgi:hypothetical protein
VDDLAAAVALDEAGGDRELPSPAPVLVVATEEDDLLVCSTCRGASGSSSTPSVSSGPRLSMPSAHRAAEVAGPDLDVVAEAEQGAVERPEDASRSVGLVDREVGSGDVV